MKNIDKLYKKQVLGHVTSLMKNTDHFLFLTSQIGGSTNEEDAHWMRVKGFWTSYSEQICGSALFATLKPGDEEIRYKQLP